MARQRSRGRRLAGVVVVTTVVCLALTITSAWAGPPPAPDGNDGPYDNPEQDLTLGAALDGDVAGLRAQAVGDFGSATSMTVQVRVTNSTRSPLDLAIPSGTILQTQDPSEQSVVVTPPDYEQISTDGPAEGSPTITLPPGDTTVELTAYCAQASDVGPFGAARLSYAGVAREPLPRVLDNIAAADPPDYVAQDAVWWVTDHPYAAVDDPQLASLLRGVDTEGFARSPTQVVPDDGYTPGWAGGSSDVVGFDPAGPPVDGRGLLTGAGLALLVLVAIVGGGLWLTLRKPNRTHDSGQSA